MPLHVANWMADPLVRSLSSAERGDLIDALARAWMGGERACDEATEPVRRAFAILWPEMAEVLAEHEEKHQKRVEAGRRGNIARWSESAADRNASPNANRIAIPNATPNGIAPQPQPQPNPQPEQEQSPSLRSGDLGTPSVSLRSTSPPAGERPAKAAPKWRRFPLESLTPEMRRFAEDRGLDADETFAEIRDHEFAVARSDPAATWRRWCRNAERYAARVPRGVPPRGQFMSASQRGTETAKRVLAETLAEELRAGRETQRTGLRRLGGVS